MRQSSRTGAILCLLLAGAVPCTSQTRSTEWHPILQPYYFYSPTSGLGAGGGVQARHIFLDADAGRVILRAQQFRQSIETGWARRDPSEGPPRFLVRAGLYRNLRESYYGTGPGAAQGDQHRLNRVQADLEMRYTAFQGAQAWIQPRAGIQVDRIVASWVLHPELATAYALGLEQELAGLEQDGLVSGLSLGLDAGWTPGPGFAAQAHLTHRIHGAGERQTVGGVALDWTRELGGTWRFYGRMLIDHTFYRTAGLPFYLRPRLDHRLTPGLSKFRFYDDDRMVLGGTVIKRLIRILKSHDIEGFAAVSLGQVYGDLPRDFQARIAIAPDRGALRSGRVPLEPTMALGLQVISLRSGSSMFEAALGFSAEGIDAAIFRFTQQLTAWNSALR